ncbi:hypothetical protein RFI_33567 [Reticulomyxa filosa]|uniref:Uncharacterized protein n=1 Tax=Reticulomyxa filosa TaxID=46433 RepID=X6LSX6_RETFI|nr:hypothetical protein RFI_33567 [Reticulomyxa filosa]|eukprot:ETO03835.1 hypothetical protein RFI_33567 [Reticulomyxa filosa]
MYIHIYLNGDDGSGGNDGTEFTKVKEENKKLQKKVRELQQELTDEMNRSAWLNVERRSSMTMAEQWKTEAEKLKQLMQPQDDDNDEDDDYHTISITANTMPMTTAIATTTATATATATLGSALTDNGGYLAVKSTAYSDSVPPLNRQSVNAVIVSFQKEVQYLRSLLGDKASQVPSTIVPNFFSNEDLADGLL